MAKPNSKRRSQPLRSFRPILEVLEDRRLLSTGLSPVTASATPTPPLSSLLAQKLATPPTSIVSTNGLVGPAIAGPGFATPTYLVVNHPTISKTGMANPQAFDAPYGQGYSPAQLQTAYGFNQLSFLDGNFSNAGAGQTIAIIDAYDDPNIATDLENFDINYGIGGASGNDLDTSFFTKLNEYGETSPLPSSTAPLAAGWGVEISLDVEWAHAMAPSAKIILYEANSQSYTDLFQAVSTAAATNGVSVVSMSFGGSEFPEETAYDSTFTTPAGHLDSNGNPGGVTFLAASGDYGEPGLYPAYSPNVLAAGGTSLSLNFDNSVSSETAWSGSGGGISQYEAQPAYQNNTQIQTDLANEGYYPGSSRTIPDVAYDADPNTGEGILDTYDNPYYNVAGWTQIGGTSAASPQWASIIAIADQYRVSVDLPTMDGATQTLPLLYQIFENDTGAFNDITSGSNGFNAGTGYDLVTGLGSPEVQNLIPDFNPNMAVVYTNPASGSFVSTPPTTVTVEFSNPFVTDPNDVILSDFTLDGVSPDSFITSSDPDSLTLVFNTSPVTTPGPQTFDVQAGAVIRAADSDPVGAFSDTIYYGTQQLQETSTSPTDGSIIDLPGDLIVTFNQDVDPSSVSTSNITLNEGTVTNAAVVPGSPNEVDYTITAPGSDNGTTLTVNMAYGAVFDTYGNPGLAFTTSYQINPYAPSHLVITQGPGLTTLASLTNSDGYNPFAGVVADSNGDLFGTTIDGGAYGFGSVYEIVKGSNTITTLASFDYTNYGANPENGVILDSNGNLYGTTASGGPGGYGTVFEVVQGSGVLTTLASFDYSNGAYANGLTLDSSGNLYATTYEGGYYGYGTVFEVASGSGTVTTLASFDYSNGAYPYASVVMDSSGNVYGTTPIGGSNGDGTVFEVTSGSYSITTLASFDSYNGYGPYGGVAMDSSGNLYGTTAYGGAYADGTVYEVAAGSYSITTLASFNYSNGAYPFASLTLDSTGNLYGTTEGGASGYGTVFELASGSGIISTLATFDYSNGAYPYTGLTMDSSGTLYGTTYEGGDSGYGTIFELPVPLPIAGQTLAPALQVSLEDYYGDVVTSSTAAVTIAVSSGPGDFASGTLTENAVDGVATFPDLVLDTAGNYTLTATDSTDELTSASTNFTVNPAAASQLVITETPGTTIVGADLSPAFQVALEDQYSNLAYNSTASVTVSVTGPDNFASGSITTVNAMGGYATFSNLILDTPGTYTLTATLETAGGPTSVTSSSFTVNPVLVVTQTPGTTTAGQVLSPSLQVSVEDGYGNPVTSSTAALTVSVLYGPGGFASGTLTENAVNGVATFADLVLDTAGSYTLAISDYPDGLTTTYTSYGAITVTAAAASQLVITQTPGASVTTLAPLGGTNGTYPQASVILDSNGDLFGTTANGGAYGDGTVYEIASGSTTITTLASFNSTDGANPEAGVILDGSGNLFGTTYNGGAYGYGTVFEIARGTNKITTLASFNYTDGANPYSGVVEDSNGDLFGSTWVGGTYGVGTVFEITAGSGAITSLASFDGANGANPVGYVVLDSNGNFYGTTNYGGGSYNGGTIYEVASGSNAITVLATFVGTNGAQANGVIEDSSGNLYGTTTYGGTYNVGIVFELPNNNTGNIITLATFDGSDQSESNAGLTMDSSGNLYGTTLYGGEGYGVVFEVSNTDVLSTLASFDYYNTGAYPDGGVTVDNSGNLYGTVTYGGAHYGGTVFELANGSGTITPIASFNQSNGTNPYSGVIADSSGNLFGTTDEGGAYGYGTVYELAKGSNTVTTLASFDFYDGAYPLGSLAIDSSGNLYGTTEEGGSNYYGTVFEIAKGSGTITTLASLDYYNTGGYPVAGVTLDSSGDLFGTAEQGGPGGYGTVVEVVQGSGVLTTLASFDYYDNGGYPVGGVTLDSSGNLYGTTLYGGAYYEGTVYELAYGSNTITTLASFDYSNGAYPESGVTLDSSGNLFGTTEEGGTYGVGTVYELTYGSGTITTLASFDYYSTGGYPIAGVIEDSSGNLYGTTYEGGPDGYGTVYELANGSGSITTLGSFDYYNNGGYPYGALTIDSTGNIFGTTFYGGTNYAGTVFELESLIAGQVLTPSVQVSVEDQYGNLVTDSTAAVTVSANGPGSFTTGSTTTVDAVNGVATFSNLVLDTAGTYTVTATDTPDDLTPATSTSFKVLPAAASQLVITQTPGTSTAGQVLSPSLQVSVEDQYGNVETGNSAAVTVSVASGPGSFTSGTLTVNAVNGVATFSDLVLGTAGTYTLTVTDTPDGLTPATTSSFTVNPVFSVASTSNATVLQNVASGFIGLATFSQVGGSANASDYTATVTWGDGKTSSSSGLNPAVSISVSGGTVTITGDHTYTNAGQYDPIVTLTYEGVSVSTNANAIVINVATDVTSHIKTKATPYYRNPLTKLTTSTLTVTNKGTTSLSGEFCLVLQGLTSGVTLHSATITIGSMTYNLTITMTAAGDPMIIIPETDLMTLGGGKSFQIALAFSNPSNTLIKYNPYLYSNPYDTF